ncbi:hypothetical protein AB834_05585 [PVC group bacterium (ex Bugula neritina AB1)]|nr:hypothetical protein AB834_05585 [PVC group bacterium (ex Bugula neritina AB1)]
MDESQIFFENSPFLHDVYPFTRTRPFSSLRLGRFTFAQRWENFKKIYSFSDGTSSLLVHPGIVLLSSVKEALLKLDPSGSLWINDTCVAVAVPFEKEKPDLKTVSKRDIISLGYTVQNIQAFLIDHPTDLLKANALYLKEETDFPAQNNIDQVDLIGDKKNFYLGKNVRFYGRVTINVEEGPVIIDEGAVIKAPTVIEGPSYIGAKSILSNANIRSCTTIGPSCKISGEVSSSVFDSFSNKAHDGFVGDSYIGSWVNFGAMSTTSNLKNTYGNIKYWDSKKYVKSDCNHLGSFIADYVTLGVGTLLPAGCVIESGVNFFGGGVCPQYLPPFIWGSRDHFEEYRYDKMIDVFSIMQKRRQQCFTEKTQVCLKNLFQRTSYERKSFLKKI